MKQIDGLVLDENNVAFHPMMGNSYQLNFLAKEIIGLLKLNKNKNEIIDEIYNKYEVSKEDLFIDVNDFFTKLKIYGLV